MGCCDSKERKDKESKIFDESGFDEDSTKLEQDDFKINILKRNLQRQEVDKGSQKQKSFNQLPESRKASKNVNEMILKDNNILNFSNNIMGNEIANDSPMGNQARNGKEILNKSRDVEDDDKEERKSVYTEYYTPPNNPSEIPVSYQEDSFMLDLPLHQQPKAYMEFDPHDRRTLIKQNFEEHSDQLIRSGSVPIYLKNSKAFIITSGGSNFDLKQFLEETKSALETLQQANNESMGSHKEEQKEQHEQKNIPIPDSPTDESEITEENDGFESPKNLFDAEFDREVSEPFKSENGKKLIKKYDELKSLENLALHRQQIKNLKMEQRWDYINIEEDLTPKEQKIFQQFKEYFNEVIDYPLKADISDHYLVRFLTARKFDLNNSKKLLDSHLSWRVNEKIDTIFQDIKFEECEDIKKYYPHGLHYTDKEGRPIYIERLGQLDQNKLFGVISQEKLVQYYIHFYEKIIKNIFQLCTDAKGRKIDKMVVILDCKDISHRVDQITSFLRTAVNITKENYPEILHKMYVVNTGMMVNLAWKAVSVIIGEKTKKKINILGSKFIHELEEDIPKEHIPKFLGGKCTCPSENCMNSDVGPY